MAWTHEDAAHLLRRGGFGGSTQQVDALYAKGRAAAVDAMLAFDTTDDPAWDAPDPLGLGHSPSDNLDATLTLIYRYLATTRPLQARLTCFWQDYFSAMMRQAGVGLSSRQVDLWRDHAIGPFNGFLLALRQRSEGRPGNDRILALAIHDGEEFESNVKRMSVSRHGSAVALSEKAVRKDSHDVRLDQTKAPWIDCLETRLDVCTKLYQHFVSDEVSAIELNHMMLVWKRSGGDLRAVLAALLKSNAFWDKRARGALVKSALEFAGGLLQRFDHELDADVIHEVALRLPELGPNPMAPRGTSGIAPTGATVLLARYQFAYYAIYEIDADRVAACMTRDMPHRMLPNAFITFLAQRLGLALLTAATRNSILEYLGTGPITEESRHGKTLGALYMLACSPEYQVS